MKRIFKNNYKVTQRYSTSHGGLDIVGIDDTNLISPVDGVVKSSTIITDKTNLTWEWGNYVRVDDYNGNRYYFCHLKSRAVKVGDSVKVGDRLGVMGNTGKSFGAHCHFETRTKSNTRTNPANFLEIPNTEATYKWEKTDNGWRYGAFKKCWCFIDKKWYYFDEEGFAVKGTKLINGKVYCFAPESYHGIEECQLIETDNKGEIKNG